MPSLQLPPEIRAVFHKFYTDLLIKLSNGKMLILEVKGKDDQQQRTKRDFLNEWIKAMNSDGRFGKWAWAVSFRTSDIKDILRKQSESQESKND